ncbi:MAG: cyclic nucleotide-binding domain-containing protein, partial [Xanthomonadales bacterium]|nr:cyclic nucleotide-binding domain-containing protein [Xanthomonadales bacterium]
MSDSPFVDFPAGSNLISEGEAASALFVLESGKAVVERADAPGVVLAELGPGDFCGEMSILQEQPHSASVIARSAVRALRIDVASFHAVLKENPEVGVHMMRRLVLRLRASEARRALLENMQSSPAPRAAAAAAPAAAAPAGAAAPASKPAAPAAP